MNALDALLLLETPSLKAGLAAHPHALVRLEALGRPDRKRPPLDLVACIDVSGSMSGPKLEAVRRALHALASELSGEDRLGLTTFEAEVRQALPPTAMDREGKARLRAAVDRLVPLGNTFMSGGLLGALDDLHAAPAPAEGAVRRVLLFTDGHANHGLSEADREGWAQLLGKQLRGTSVSWFGFGEDHDAEFLAWLADLSRGNAYVAKDADAISDGFAQELGGLLGVRATDITVTLSVKGGSAALLNEEASEQKDGAVRVKLADLSCEERRDLVFALAVPPSGAGAPPLSVDVQVRFRDALSGDWQEAALRGEVAFTDGAPATPRLEVVEAAALVLAGLAQGRARAFSEQRRWTDAAAAIHEAAARLRAVGTERASALAENLARLAGEYGDPAVYGTSKSKLMASRRAFSKQRSSGSDMDGFFSTESKRAMQERFRAQREAEEAQVDTDLVRRLEQEMVDHLRQALTRARVRGPRRPH
ncbi:MAG: VWA domain-containing protein [Deltaproteobacteria bacterium]|nr:VWA domain-containing protein [Deltaproteobacteria bacterium]